jgi:hypothetical protein
MQLNPKNMKRIPFSVGNCGNVPITLTSGQHKIHSFATSRVKKTITKTQHNNVFAITMIVDQTADTVYLPFSRDYIHSIELPAIPPAGVECFLTANLDGCCMFIEVKTNGNIVVYHANMFTGASPTAVQSATQPTFQTPACLTGLNNLYTAASAHYAGTANSIGVQALKKATYLKEVDTILLHKTAQGRQGIQFGGGAEHASLSTFAGFYKNNHWEFWYQTYSQFIYSRPATHWKSQIGHSDVNPNALHDDYKITDCRLYFTS